MEVTVARKRNEVGKWKKTPEQYYELESFSELQQIYDKMGLDFIIPVRSIWTYNISDEEYIKKIKDLDLSPDKKNLTELERYIIKEINSHAKTMELIKAGASIVFQE